MNQAIVDAGTGAHLNLTSNYGYNANGDRTSETNPRGYTTTHVYNSSRWRTVTTETAPYSLETSYGYDTISNLTSTSRQTGGTPTEQTTSTTYIDINKPLVVTDPLLAPTSFGYDALGRKISTLDALNNLRQYTLDENGRLVVIIDADGVDEETRGLYPGGYVNTTADARGNTSTFVRDSIARLTQITYPDASLEKWTLDDNGNVTSYTTRGGKVVTQTFDGCNRVLTRAPASEPKVTYTYDLAGRLLTASKPVVAGDASSGSFSRAYDTAGRLMSETDSQSAVLSYQLDQNGNVTEITYPSGYYVTRAYDQLDRLTSITLNGASAPAATFEYDGLDRRINLSYNNSAVTIYSYDIGNNRLTSELTTGATDVSWGYDYNAVHQIMGKMTSDSTWEWLLNTTADVAYGTASNLNAYPTVGGVTQTYDTSGRLTNDGTFTYTYNTENMLTEVQDAAGTTVATFFYDPFKRQVQKTASSTTRYVYSGSQLMEEYNSTAGLPGTLIRRYIYAGPGEAIFQTDGDGNVTYLHNDHQGSLVAQSNGSGTVEHQYTYSPFGENTGLAGSVIGYTGQRYDSETGLYYYKARYYKPSIGRFLQPDPAGYAPGMNLYGYVHNDPVNRSDPSGMDDFPNNLDPATRHPKSTYGSAYEAKTLPNGKTTILMNPEALKDPKTTGAIGVSSSYVGKTSRNSEGVIDAYGMSERHLTGTRNDGTTLVTGIKEVVFPTTEKSVVEAEQGTINVMRNRGFSLTNVRNPAPDAMKYLPGLNKILNAGEMASPALELLDESTIRFQYDAFWGRGLRDI